MKKLLTSGLMIFCLGCSNPDGELREASFRADSLQTALNHAKAKADSLQQRRGPDNPNPWYDPSIYAAPLRKAGISNPENYIEQSLRDQPERIPLKSVLGGTMRFVRMELLGPHWVIAEYEDGHISGRTIYAYSIKKDGTVEFKELSSSRD